MQKFSNVCKSAVSAMQLLRLLVFLAAMLPGGNYLSAFVIFALFCLIQN